LDVNESKDVKTLLLTNIDGLDPITVFLEDFGNSCGRITFVCWGKAWSGFWGAMGGRTITKFFLDSGEHYLAQNIDTDIESEVVDYKTIGQEIDKDVDHETLMVFQDDVALVYGEEWFRNLPMVPNPKYEYLCRIILAVQEGLKCQ